MLALSNSIHLFAPAGLHAPPPRPVRARRPAALLRRRRAVGGRGRGARGDGRRRRGHRDTRAPEPEAAAATA